MRLSKEERIKRAGRIREERRQLDIENTQEYLGSISLKVNRIFTLFLTAYVLVSFIPYYPKLFNEEQVVTFNDSYEAHSSGRTGSHSTVIIKIATDELNNYEIDGRSMGERAFKTGDTIVARKNVLFKTTYIRHNKYRISYPLEKHFPFLIILSITCILLIIVLISKSYKLEMTYNVLTGTALLVFLMYLIN